MTLSWQHVRHDLVPELSDDDRAVIERTSYGTPRGLGNRPALILVDFQYAYLGADVPITEQLADHPAAGGANAWAALRRALPLLALARERKIPVVLSRIAYPAGREQSNTFAAKRGVPQNFIDGAPGAKLADELAPATDDIVLRKEAASCFHQTDLVDELRRLDVDTVVVGGLSTSGCVRATVVDAAGYGLRAAALSDACADRIDLSHRVALFDVWMKYGDVVSTSEAIDYFTTM